MSTTKKVKKTSGDEQNSFTRQLDGTIAIRENGARYVYPDPTPGSRLDAIVNGDRKWSLTRPEMDLLFAAAKLYQCAFDPRDSSGVAAMLRLQKAIPKALWNE